MENIFFSKDENSDFLKSLNFYNFFKNLNLFRIAQRDFGESVEDQKFAEKFH